MNDDRTQRDALLENAQFPELVTMASQGVTSKVILAELAEIYRWQASSGLYASNKLVVAEALQDLSDRLGDV